MPSEGGGNTFILVRGATFKASDTWTLGDTPIDALTDPSGTGTYAFLTVPIGLAGGPLSLARNGTPVGTFIYVASAHVRAPVPALALGDGGALGDLALADLDGDGYPDTLVFTRAGAATVFEAPAGPSGLGAVTSGITFGAPVSHVVVGRFDGDALSDVVALEDAGIEVAYGASGSATSVSSGTLAEAAVAADLDGDGVDELLVSNRAGDSEVSGTGNVLVFGRAGADWALRQVVPNRCTADGGPTDDVVALAAIDLDGDGVLDVVAVPAHQTSPCIAFGEHDGGFAPMQRLPALPAAASRIAAGGIDGSGYPGLAMSTPSGLAVLHNQGSDGDGGLTLALEVLDALTDVEALAVIDSDGYGTAGGFGVSQASVWVARPIAGDVGAPVLTAERYVTVPSGSAPPAIALQDSHALGLDGVAPAALAFGDTQRQGTQDLVFTAPKDQALGLLQARSETQPFVSEVYPRLASAYAYVSVQGVGLPANANVALGDPSRGVGTLVAGGGTGTDGYGLPTGTALLTLADDPATGAGLLLFGDAGSGLAPARSLVPFEVLAHAENRLLAGSRNTLASLDAGLALVATAAQMTVGAVAADGSDRIVIAAPVTSADTVLLVANVTMPGTTPVPSLDDVVDLGSRLTPGAVTLADANHDGYVDALVLDTTHNTVIVVPGPLQPTPPVGPFASYRVGMADASGPHALQAADLDGDGNMDLLVLATGGTAGLQTVELLRGLADGTFAPARPYDAGLGTPIDGFGLEDVDQDGTRDLIFTSGTAMYFAQGQAGQLAFSGPQTLNNEGNNPFVAGPWDLNGAPTVTVTFSHESTLLEVTDGSGTAQLPYFGPQPVPGSGDVYVAALGMGDPGWPNVVGYGDNVLAVGFATASSATGSQGYGAFAEWSGGSGDTTDAVAISAGLFDAASHKACAVVLTAQGNLVLGQFK